MGPKYLSGLTNPWLKLRSKGISVCRGNMRARPYSSEILGSKNSNKIGLSITKSLFKKFKKMGEIRIKKQPKKYDAVIVGSGAGGGMAAYVLSKAGFKICLLEAGGPFDPAINSAQLKNPWESP